jgi:hypothetical protein
MCVCVSIYIMIHINGILERKPCLRHVAQSYRCNALHEDTWINPKNVNWWTSRYIEGLMILIKCQFHTLTHDTIKWKCCNPTNLEILKTIKSTEF